MKQSTLTIEFKTKFNNNLVISFARIFFKNLCPFCPQVTLLYLQNKDCLGGFFSRSEGICKNSKLCLKVITPSLKGTSNVTLYGKFLIRYHSSWYRKTGLEYSFHIDLLIKIFYTAF